MHLWLLIAAIQATQAEPARAPPIDQCGNDASFSEYRDRLAGAVARKDVAALRPLVAADVTYSFGDERGWPGLVREWRLDRPAESGLWLELAEVLELGCGEYDGSRMAPGNFNSLSHYGDGLQAYFAIQNDAALGTSPDDAASPVILLDHHVLVEILGEDPAIVPEGWLHARLTDGRAGYVRLSAVRSAIDYRATFEKRNGRWVMTSFVAGD